MSWKRIDAAERSKAALKPNHARPYLGDLDLSRSEVAEIRGSLERVHLAQRGPAQDRARRLLALVGWYESAVEKREEQLARFRALEAAVDDLPTKPQALVDAIAKLEDSLDDA